MRNFTFVTLAALFLTFCGLSAANAQTPTPKPKASDDEIIKVSSRLIVVPVSITDQNGQPVVGLTAQDFRISEENRPQTIETVSGADKVPLEIVLLFDVSASTDAMFQFELDTAAKFLKDVMRPEDRAAVFTIGGKPVLVQPRSTGTNAEASEEPTYELKSANINGLLKGRFDQNVTLEAGDIINIPLSDVFFVAGEVNAPGEFALKEGTTLRQAISLAQGTNYKAALKSGVVYRENANGKREEVHVDIGAVMAGKKEDVLIMANDIIMVPNSRGKTIGGALLKAFGLTTITRMPL